MSGIAGIIHFDGAPVSPGQIEKMTSSMSYRGPDGIHHWTSGSVALGQCMLHTTPESQEEIQPLTNENETLILVMDGRVDNWLELRRDLQAHGALMRNHSDAELVLRAYEIWGQSCLQHIDGDFALVIWDTNRQEAFCARDRLGNKPLNYFWDGKSLVFASELHAILALPWIARVLNENVLAEFLAWEFYTRDETLWNGIFRLVAAHEMIVGHKGPRLKKYWEPDCWQDLSYSREDEYFDHYRELITESVRQQSRSHQPVSIEISGGLDSSAVICLAQHLCRLNRLPAPSIEGYTLAFKNNEAANELSYARAVGEFLDLQLHEISPSQMPLTWYEKQVKLYFDFPCYPNASMFLGIMEQAAKKGSRVMLTGEGGDEWLGGSREYYAEELSKQRWQNIFKCYMTDARAFSNRQALYWFLRFGLFPLLPRACQNFIYNTYRNIRGSKIHNTYWLSSSMKNRLEICREQNRPSHKQPIGRVGQRELFSVLHAPFDDLVMEQVERNSARLGLEMRYPLRSHRIVQFAFSIPERFRLRGDINKYIHVKALQNYMPDVILARKDKAEFSEVFRSYLDQMNELYTRIIPRNLSDRLSLDGMRQLFKYYEDNPQLGLTLWILWSIFVCQYLDNECNQ